MFPRKTLFIIVLLTAISGDFVFAQRANSGKSSLTRTKYSLGSKPRIKGRLFESNDYPRHGLGFKLGDPLAITYKLYGADNFSFAIDFGNAASNLYTRYYRAKFDEYAKSDTFSTAGASLRYINHRVKSDVVGEARLMYNLDASFLPNGFMPYVGIGWEWKSTHLQYGYLYNSVVIENKPGQFTRNRLTMGPQFILGIEYAYGQIPIAAFLEFDYYTDVQVDPGWHRLEGGIGLRYIF